jgi:hypothetical protein
LWYPFISQGLRDYRNGIAIIFAALFNALTNFPNSELKGNLLYEQSSPLPARGAHVCARAVWRRSLRAGREETVISDSLFARLFEKRFASLEARAFQNNKRQL